MHKIRFKVLMLALVLTLFVPLISAAELLDDNIPVAINQYDQQNPHTIFLPDKNLYFVVWEDWRNKLSTGADIYGRFIKPRNDNDANDFCGPELVISNAAGNQTVPRAAYRDGLVQDVSVDTNDRVIVVWQDTRKTTNVSGFVYYTVIDVSSFIPNEQDCSLEGPIPLATAVAIVPTPDTQSATSSRTVPKVTYDLINDRFILAWVESRTTLKTSKFRPFLLNSAEPSWSFGDTQFVGYAAIYADIAGYETSPTIFRQWNDCADLDLDGFCDRDMNVYTRARLISRGSETLKVVSVYEFFDGISNVDVSCDTTTPECLFVWEGKRGIFTRTDKCTDVPSGENDGVCDGGVGGEDIDVVGSTATTEYSPTNKEVFGIFEKSLPLNVVYSTRISNSNTGAYLPSIGFDPITKRFLVAWEDIRKGSNTKIYGQIVDSGSDPYSTNFLISYQDTNGDGQLDSNVANSKQTKPFVSYDSVNQRYFVVWQDGRNSTLSLENLDIYGQKVDAEGSLRGDNYAVVVQPFNQFIPTIAFNDVENHFLAVWKDARNLSKNNCGTSQPCGSDVYGQRFTLDNSAITLLNMDNTLLAPPLLNRFENPSGSNSVEVGLFATQSFKIRNTGDTILKIDYIDNTCGETLPDISPFSFDGLPSELNARGEATRATLDLVPSAELTLTVRVTPLAAGSYNRCFIIETDGGNPRVNLSALAIESNITISPASPFGFGDVYIGSFKEQTFVVRNTGLAALRIGSLINPSSPFTIQSDGCSGKSIASGSTCNVVVRFTPHLVSDSASQFGISSNDPDTPTLNVIISGTGVGAQDITVTPLSVNFGNVQVGQTSQQTITIKNDGTLNLTINQISSPIAPFSRTLNCQIPLILAQGESCQITVEFSPTTIGGVSSNLTITSDDPDEEVVIVSLSGTGVVTPDISANPSFINFSATVLGTTSQQSITVTNIGTADLVITSLTNPSEGFSIVNSTCIGTFAPSATCDITVAFSPTSAGFKQSSFKISSNDPDTPEYTILLSGAGGAGPQKVAISSTVVDFGIVDTGTLVTQTLTITNNGGSPLTIRSISGAKRPFSIVGNSCSNQTLSSGDTCEVTVSFNARFRGIFKSSLTIRSNDPTRPRVKVGVRGAARF